MGNSEVKAVLPRKQVEKLTQKTTLTEDELHQLYSIFTSISTSINSDEYIDREEFQQALGFVDSFFASRLFKIFDENNDGQISFEEFATVYSILSPKGTPAEKIDLSFKIYDVDGDGYIDKQELFQILRAALYDNLDVPFTVHQLRRLVENTFQEVDANGDGMISLQEYRSMCVKYPGIVDNLTIRVTMPTSSSEQLKKQQEAQQHAAPAAAAEGTPAGGAGSAPEPASVLSLSSGRNPTTLDAQLTVPPPRSPSAKHSPETERSNASPRPSPQPSPGGSLIRQTTKGRVETGTPKGKP